MNEKKISKWEKLYKSREAIVKRLEKENFELRGILDKQIKTNDAIDKKMVTQDMVMQNQFGNHNLEMQNMAAKIAELSAKVISLGGILEN